MDNENFNNSELEDLRRQMSMLQERIDKGTTISKNQVERAIHSGLGKVVKREVMSIIIILATIVLYSFVHQWIGMSTGLVWFVQLLMVVALMCEIHLLYEAIKAEQGIGDDLIKASERLLHIKKVCQVWLRFIGLPFLVVFMAWFLYDMQTNPDFLAVPGETAAEHLNAIRGASVGGIIGAIAGGLIGYFGVYRKQVKQIDEIRRQIDDLS
ncbi:MAG: hypothetical protein KBT10_02175 [Bacteroidales bacterium]|nr:hypothetical protein [Candidatus Sodaliphilus aphodohippi]